MHKKQEFSIKQTLEDRILLMDKTDTRTSSATTVVDWGTCSASAETKGVQRRPRKPKKTREAQFQGQLEPCMHALLHFEQGSKFFESTKIWDRHAC